MHKDDYDHRLIMTIVTTNPTQICCDVSILQYWFERETSLLEAKPQLASAWFFVCDLQDAVVALERKD